MEILKLDKEYSNRYIYDAVACRFEIKVKGTIGQLLSKE